MNQWAELGLNILEILSPAILALLAWLGVKLAGWLRAKTKNELVGGMLARLTESVFTLVREAEQTAVAAIKAGKDPSSPGGTKLTKAEAEKVKADVIAKLKELWGMKGLKEIGKVLGWTEASVTSFLEAKVEEAVLADKVVANPSQPQRLAP